MFTNKPLEPVTESAGLLTPHPKRGAHHAVSRECITNEYRLLSVVDFIFSKSTDAGAPPYYQRVALQVPDSLLHDTVAVIEILEALLATRREMQCPQWIPEGPHGAEGDIKLFILADNTFGDCCPDETTAQHYNSDAIVHFGPACMSRSCRLPVFYVHDTFRFYRHHPPTSFTYSPELPITPQFPALDDRDISTEQTLYPKATFEEGMAVLLATVDALRQRIEAILPAAEAQWAQELRSSSLEAGAEGSQHHRVKAQIVLLGSYSARRFVEAAEASSTPPPEGCGESTPVAVVPVVTGRYTNFREAGSTEVGQQEPSLASSHGQWMVNGVEFPRVSVVRSSSDDDPSLQRHTLTLQYFLFVGPEDSPYIMHLLWIHQHNIQQLSAALHARCFDEIAALRPVTHINGHSLSPAAVLSGTDTTATGDVVSWLPFMGSETRLLQQRLRKRMFNIERIRVAESVGIFVTTLSIAHYFETVQLLRRFLRLHRRRVYVIFVGHLNEFKAANFVDSLDVYCVIACPNSRVVHFTQRDDNFAKPMVSPAEILLALDEPITESPRDVGDKATLSYDASDEDSSTSVLSKLFEAPMSFTTDFAAVLPYLREAVRVGEEAASRAEAAADEGAAKKEDSGRPCGTLVGIPHRGNGALCEIRGGDAVSGALQRLHERSYIGLDPKVGQTAVQSQVIEGRDGIARGYATERTRQSQDE